MSDTTLAGAAARKKLGRGLGALMGEIRTDAPIMPLDGKIAESSAQTSESTAQDGALRLIDVSAIAPLPGQPRTQFDEQKLEELAASIRARGVIQPVIVRKLDRDQYQLVAGERRWRAAQRAQLHAIPAIVRDLNEREILALALIENLQREDLNPVEEARAYRKLAEQENMTQADIATLVDKSRSHVANLQRLLDLPEAVLLLVETGRLSMGHARALIGSANAVELANRAADRQLSVREVERLAQKESTSRRPRSPAAAQNDNADIVAVQGHLEDFLGMPVRIATESDPQRGTVTIRYRTLDQLDLLCQRLTGGEI